MSTIDNRTLPKSDETIKQISDTKREQSRDEILTKAKDFNQEASSKILAVPTHRKKNHISLEEYQSLLKQGKTVPEIITTTSKHLVYFYNVLLKGGINLTKDEFTKMYDEGMSLDEIAKSKNIARENMTFLREFYGIKRKGATYQKRVANEKPLSQEAKDVIIGSLLGDGHITKWGYFSEKHSPAQLEYLKWKASFFKDITTDKSWDYYESIDKRSGALIKSHCYRTTAHSFLYEMRNKFYKEIDGQWEKIIPNDIANMMNEQILAIWFMDDGHTDWKYRNGIKMTDGSLPSCKICTESFSIENNQLLSDTIIKKFGIKSEVKFKDMDKNKPNLRFSTIDSVKLISIIYPLICKELKYKVDEKIFVSR